MICEILISKNIDFFDDAETEIVSISNFLAKETFRCNSENGR
jgi:hypothetical protein